MATKKKIDLFVEINNEKEFEMILTSNSENLICAEVYSKFVGSCTALDRLFTKIKLDWSDGKMVLLKVPADEIETLKRFRDQSEPVYLFIVKKKVRNIFRGVDSIRFGDVAKQELVYFNKELAGFPSDRPLYDLDETTPGEMGWFTSREVDKMQESTSLMLRREMRQSARKRHRAELIVPHLQNLNFVLFWPHCIHAHPELYERWDANNIIMIGREEVELDKDKALDILYAGDAPINEACIHALLSGPALAICFRLLDKDKHFVSLVRRILYEEIPVIDETKPLQDRVTAYDSYKSYSPTREEVWQKRREVRLRQKEEAIEKRARRLSEMQRLARQAIEESIEAKKSAKEQQKIELLRAGNVSAFEELKAKASDDEVDISVPEKLSDDVEEESTEEEDENEYFPPPGLLIPGFYAPPNDVAKANGLAILFPKLVAEYVVVPPEVLPPHVLVVLEINKRYRAIDAMAKYKSFIIHHQLFASKSPVEIGQVISEMGVFKGMTPYHGVHIAYSVRQYDTLHISENLIDIKLAFMLSIETDLPLLELMDLNPVHVSRDSSSGEDECAALFPVGYGDEYPEFEDFDN